MLKYIYYFMRHSCYAVAVGCIDFRLRLMTRKFIDEHLKGKDYDIVRFAGGVKEIGINAVVGAGAGWLAFEGKIPGIYSKSQEPARALAKPHTSEEQKPQGESKPEGETEEPVDPEVLLFRIDSPAPSAECETLVTNLDDLRPGGAQQAAVSLGKARQSMPQMS